MLHSYESVEVSNNISHYNIVEVAFFYDIDIRIDGPKSASKKSDLYPFCQFIFHSEGIDWNIMNDYFLLENWETEFNGMDVNLITNKLLNTCLSATKASNIHLKSTRVHKKNVIPIRR